MKRIVAKQCRLAMPVVLSALALPDAPRLPTRSCAGTGRPSQKLVEQHADVNAPQADGATALHWAVFRSDKEMVDLLLRAGANPKAANREGSTPLWLASINGDAADHRGADQSRRRCQREPPAGKDSSDGGVAHRQCRCDEGAARPRREREREGNPARNHRLDVGRGRRPCACHPASDRARRGYQGPLGSGRARKRTGARKIQRSQKSGRGAGRGARRRKSARPASLGAVVRRNRTADRAQLCRRRRRRVVERRGDGRAPRQRQTVRSDGDDAAAAFGFGRGRAGPERWRRSHAAGLCGRAPTISIP